MINARILDIRQSVFIFVCKKEEWKNFLDENLKDPKDNSKKNKRDNISACYFEYAIYSFILSTTLAVHYMVLPISNSESAIFLMNNYYDFFVNSDTESKLFWTNKKFVVVFKCSN